MTDKSLTHFTGGGCADPDRAQGERERAVAEWFHAALHGRAGGPRRRRAAGEKKNNKFVKNIQNCPYQIKNHILTNLSLT